MTRAELVFLGGLAGTDHVTQRFVRGIGNPHGGEIAGSVAAGQFLGVAAAGLNAVSGLGGTSVGAITSQATPSWVSCQ